MNSRQQDDSAKVAAVAASASGAPKRFPPAIERALALLAGSDHGALSALSMGERLLLARYVRCVDARDPCVPVRVSIRALADGLRVCARTVNTLKGTLLANGWITSHQVQSRRRGMQICDVRLTARAVQALQLLESLRRAAPPPDPSPCGPAATDPAKPDETQLASTSTGLAENVPRFEDSGSAAICRSGAGVAAGGGEAGPTESRGEIHAVCGQLQRHLDPVAEPSARACANPACACRDFKKQPLQRHPAGSGLDQNQPPGSSGAALPTWRLHRSPRLPRPLAWLEQHMSGTRVCLLMREARERGLELETVATAARDRIDRARHPFAYLRVLVKRDSTHRPAPPATQVVREAHARDQVSRWAAQAQGLAFASPAGWVHRVEVGVVRVYAPEEAAKPLGTSVGVLPLSAQFIADVTRGILKNWPGAGEAAAGDGYVRTSR